MALAAGPATPPEQQLTALPTAPVTVVPAADSTITTTPSPAASDPLPPANDRPGVAAQQTAAQQIASQQIAPQQLECVAKVIRHEAANQPVDGQVAVAQVIRTRMSDGRFPTTPCGVVKQRGQFFDVEAEDPPRNDARWALAMRIATQVMTGASEGAATGALFFHSGGVGMPGRVRVTQIADHIFYR